MASFVGSSTDGGNTTLLTLTWPTVQSGDTAIIAWTMSTTPTATPPTGFTEADSHLTPNPRTFIYYRACDGSESGTISLTVSTSTRQSAVLWVGRGLHPTTPVNAISEFEESVSGTTHDAPSVTPTVANCAIVTTVHERATNGTSDYTPPTGFDQNHADTGVLAVGNGGTVTAVASDSLAAGRAANVAVDPGVWTSAASGNPSAPPGTSTSAVVVYTIALAPSPTGEVATHTLYPPFWLPFSRTNVVPLQLRGDLSPPVAVTVNDPATATDDLTITRLEDPYQAWPGFAAMFVQPSGASMQFRGSQATVYEPALGEPATGVDDLVVTATVTLSGDTATGADSATVAVALSLTESASGADALLIAAAIAMADTATATDTQPVANTAAVPLTETGSVVEAITPAVAVPLTEAPLASDANTQTVAAPIAETATGVDDLTLSVVGDPVLVDTATAMDTMLVTAVSLTITDTATGSDVMSVNVPISLPEPVAAADVLTIAATLTLAGDAASAADNVIAGIAVALQGDTAAAVDSLASVTVTVPLAGDAVTALEGLTVAAAVPTADTAAAVEDVLPAVAVPLPDTPTATDSFLDDPVITVAMVDSATATESMTFTVEITLSDVAGALDHLIRVQEGIRGNMYPRPPRSIPGQAR